MSYFRRTTSFATLVTGLVAAAACASNKDSLGGNESAATADDSWPERAELEASYDQFFFENQEDLHWFRDVPLGEAGIPLILFKLLPDVMPDVWGEGYVERLGLFDAPTAADDPTGNAVPRDTFGLPYGLGWSNKKLKVGPLELPSMALVNLTCAACHTGRVADDDGTVHYLIGAPSQTFTAAAWRLQITNTVRDGRFTVEAFTAALNAKSGGWLYPSDPGRQLAETALFKRKMPEILKAMAERVNLRENLLQEFIGQRTYNAAWNGSTAGDVRNLLNGGTPGQVEAFGTAVSLLVPADIKAMPEGDAKEAALRAYLPPKPAVVDIMSVWAQGRRATAQWDGNIRSPLLRNLGAELGVIGDPTSVDFENGKFTTRFVKDLPAPVYPFAVDGAKAAAGKLVYESTCASCHERDPDNGGKGYDVGTDVNRAIGLTEESRKALGQAMLATCGPNAASEPECQQTVDAVITTPRSYLAPPLDGVWARAPYFHNGSVPTLAHVLQPAASRPATFVRGNIAYDKAEVGFEWRAAGPNTTVFDTAKDGYSKAGHEFGTDLAADQRDALLEYLKTL
jgi:hypothetical protein